MQINYSIGYYQNNKWGDNIRNVICDYPCVKEVYFALPGQPSGRKPLGEEWNVLETLKELHSDLFWLRERGLDLTLLLNAACYGDKLMSADYLHKMLEDVDLYFSRFGISAVTTTSPAIANLLKKTYGDNLQIRASINMRVGSIDALYYLKDLFDGYYIQRELYRSYDYLKRVKKWVVDNNKKIYALVNSGCLAYCPWQSMHDNNIAHSVFYNQLPNGIRIPECSYYLGNERDKTAILKGTFIRPEDVPLYKDIFDGFKIATRSHILPRIIIKAYSEGKFDGNLMDLLEPGNSGLFKPMILRNDVFPSDWIEHIINCNRRCHQCDYCNSMSNKLFQYSQEQTDFKKYI